MKWVKLFLLTAGNIKAQWDTGLQTCPLEGFFFLSDDKEKFNRNIGATVVLITLKSRFCPVYVSILGFIYWKLCDRAAAIQSRLARSA